VFFVLFSRWQSVARDLRSIEKTGAVSVWDDVERRAVDDASDEVSDVIASGEFGKLFWF
jgi:hypothetical protein